MNDGLDAAVAMLSLFGGTSLIIWTSMKAKIARIKAEAEAKRIIAAPIAGDAVLNELKAMKQQMAEMHSTSHQFDIAFDAALSRLEERSAVSKPKSPCRRRLSLKPKKHSAWGCVREPNMELLHALSLCLEGLGVFGGIGLIILADNKGKIDKIKAQRQLKQEAGAPQNESLAAELRALKEQVSEMQNTGHQFDISFDAALSRLEERVSRVETKFAAPTATASPEETQHVGRR